MQLGKYIIYLLSFAFALQYAQGQSAESIVVLPQAGDSVFYLVDNLPGDLDLGIAGPDQVWDFTSLKSPFVRKYVYEAGEKPNETVIKKSEASFQNIIRDQVVYLSCIKNADPLLIGSQIELRGSPPLLEYKNPIQYNDASSEYSRFIGYIPWNEIPLQFHLEDYDMMDTVRVVLEINRDDAVDAWGSLLLQNDAFDVVRERRIEEQQLTLWARDGGQDWLDITPIMKSSLKDIVWSSVTYSYIFLADGQASPIAEVYTDEDDKIEKVIYSSDVRYGSKVIRADKKLRGVYVFPNPSFGNVRFEFFNLPSGEYELSVSNLLGKKLWSSQELIEDGTVIEADISFLKRGTYYYSLINKNGRRIDTRRLIILKV